MSATEQIRTSIRSQLEQLEAEIARLQYALEVLDNHEGQGKPFAASRRPPSKRNARKRKSKPKQTSEALLAGQLERMLADSDGLTTVAIAERGNADRDQVLTLLRELEAARRVRRSGQRRGTRWHAVTDEDRIRERAAELEARMAGSTAGGG